MSIPGSIVESAEVIYGSLDVALVDVTGNRVHRKTRIKALPPPPIAKIDSLQDAAGVAEPAPVRASWRFPENQPVARCWKFTLLDLQSFTPNSVQSLVPHNLQSDRSPDGHAVIAVRRRPELLLARRGNLAVPQHTSRLTAQA